MELDKIKSQFGKQAENYIKYRKPYPDNLYKLFFSLLPAGSKKILDIACGPGNSTERLLSEDSKVFGCDIDPLMIEEARKQTKSKNLNIEYSVSSAEKLPYEDNCFDAINVGTAFHWFANEQAIGEIKRVLKSGRMLFVFWTLTAKDERNENEKVSKIFNSLNWPKIPQELRNLEYISTFFKINGFQNVETKSIAVTHNATVEERVGLEKTNAGYGLLSEEGKNKFLDDLTLVYKLDLADKEYFTINEELQVVYGFKA